MENLKTYPVAHDWYANKLSGKIARFIRASVGVALLILIVMLIISYLDTHTINSMKIQNLKKYHNEQGFIAITH